MASVEQQVIRDGDEYIIVAVIVLCTWTAIYKGLKAILEYYVQHIRTKATIQVNRSGRKGATNNAFTVLDAESISYILAVRVLLGALLWINTIAGICLINLYLKELGPKLGHITIHINNLLPPSTIILILLCSLVGLLGATLPRWQTIVLAFNAYVNKDR